MARKRVICFFVVFSLISGGYSYPQGDGLMGFCPRLYKKSFKGYVPQGNLSAGIFDQTEITNLKECVLKCCLKDKCNVAFMSEDKCYHISCYTNEMCAPIPSQKPNSVDRFTMVLVKPTDDDTWGDVLNPKDISKEQYDFNPFEVYKDLAMDETFRYGSLACELGDSLCSGPHELCVPNRANSRAGTCRCIEGYIRNPDGDCLIAINDVAAVKSLLADKIMNDIGETTISALNTSKPVTRRHLAVMAESKEVRLPRNEVTLMAKVEEPSSNPEEDKYQFTWTSLHQPDGSTAVKNQNGGELHLEKLVEGVYEFKVSAVTVSAYGETFVNVTVLPASRINKPPVIVITPANQTIKQPNSAAVMDASSSTDDDGIVSWHWELQQGPVGYQPQLKETSTLQLNDLNKPGNYSFKLTVTDTDKASSSSVANVTVLKFTDYPPEANAGEDKIIYLPRNSIILNGNMSTDDHNITIWEWTKSAGDEQKAVDMQDTHTPYLKLSNLEEGMYTFTLKVTDSNNKSSTAQVHVFVKPPTNKPPVANAGGNRTISLPQTWVVVDAKNSSDDNKITAFRWEQIEGPSTVVFENANASKTNVTGLTKGVYNFKVSVTDDNNNVASDALYVIVNQNINQKPTSNAGPDFSIDLPRNVIMINGSNSKDDWAITRWQWTRDAKSLAVGNVAEKSDASSILILTDVVVGKYVFNLTVYDEQGLSDSDSVTVTVNDDPKTYYLVDLTVDVEVNSLTEEQFNTLKGKLALLIVDGTKLQVRSVKPHPGSVKSTITFYVEGVDGNPVSANGVVAHLRQKLALDAGILGYGVAKLQTVVCQNNCSGHGICNEVTRMCECETFWMRNLFKVYLNSTDDSDCSWSLLYVVLGALCTVVLFVGSTWGLIYLCYTWCNKRGGDRKSANYNLIENTDDLPPFSSRKHGSLSDSDTDSDVVFESRSKPSRKSVRNGLTKHIRRGLKT
ncbi:unnamed protein product [Brassicogethes aeneus]|uniref:Dyslexia-associated protein KIAA0319-like protein n=1 Tax=Brassicogethes aeneus TaxID=1431903 RepID=A0A9P0BK69_BRAAE|nr:unnamed protein product [Brassicogethes aeneus]